MLISSGSRQNYTLGTSDEGVLAFRKMEDVNCLVGTLMGGDSTGLFDMEVDNDMSGVRNQKKKLMVMSAADRVLTRASDRALGVVVSSSSQCDKKRKKSGWDSRSHVVAIDRMKQGGDENDDSDNDSFSPYGGATSLIDWLSEPSRKKKVKEEDVDCEEEVAKHKPKQIEGKEPVVLPLDRSNKDGTSELSNSEEEDKDDIEDGFIAL